MILRDNIRATDFPARYGGEEFAVLLPRTDKYGAVVVAERLRARIAAYPMPNQSITVSLGIAEFPSDTQSVEHIVARADKAMYVAKSYGKNTTCLWCRDHQSSLGPDGVTVVRANTVSDCIAIATGNTPRLTLNASETPRVLVVDRDEMVAGMIRENLGQFGYSVVVAHSGRVALSKIAEGAGMFDAMLTEVALPDRTGFELREQAQALQPGIPVIFMSTVAHKDWSRKSPDHADEEILAKPINFATLLGVLGNQRGTCRQYAPSAIAA
jgi:PleD family two-component response regulator